MLLCRHCKTLWQLKCWADAAIFSWVPSYRVPIGIPIDSTFGCILDANKISKALTGYSSIIIFFPFKHCLCFHPLSLHDLPQPLWMACSFSLLLVPSSLQPTRMMEKQDTPKSKSFYSSSTTHFFHSQSLYHKHLISSEGIILPKLICHSPTNTVVLC